MNNIAVNAKIYKPVKTRKEIKTLKIAALCFIIGIGLSMFTKMAQGSGSRLSISLYMVIIITLGTFVLQKPFPELKTEKIMLSLADGNLNIIIPDSYDNKEKSCQDKYVIQTDNIQKVEYNKEKVKIYGTGNLNRIFKKNGQLTKKEKDIPFKESFILLRTEEWTKIKQLLIQIPYIVITETE